MTDYTKRNASELTDSAPQFGFEDVQEARFGAKELGAERTGFAHHVVKAGRRQGFGHSHDDAEEVYFVVSGSGRVRLDDETVELAERDLLRVAPAVMRRFEAGDEGLELLAFGPRHEGDGQIDPEFWAPGEE